MVRATEAKPVYITANLHVHEPPSPASAGAHQPRRDAHTTTTMSKTTPLMISSFRRADHPMGAPDQPLRLCIFGAPPGTGNLGVTALNRSLLEGIARRAPDAAITVFDDQRGIRMDSAPLPNGRLPYRLCGAIPTRRIYLRDSLWRIRLSGRLGGLGNPAIRALRAADGVLDVTGGDSFTDLYGPRRFRWATLDKLIALEQGAPLILAPQTIGPFRSARSRRIGRRILRAATMIWARDTRSYAFLRELLGADFDPDRHRCGVDLAFALEARRPERPLDPPVSDWLADDASRPVIGFNVSGLLSNNAAASRARFGLRAEYDRAVIGFLQRILRETDANVLLMPHVATQAGHHEHDPDACASVTRALRDVDKRRIATVSGIYEPGEMKWIIARTDWFCATRMHAGIAALSSGVPTAAIAYSHKTRGVYDTCGQGWHVADPRESDTAQVIDHLWESWMHREAAAADLRHRLPFVLRQAEDQMSGMLAGCGIEPAQTARDLRRAA